MATRDWKSGSDESGKAPPGGEGQILSAPIEHQGVRNALRGAFRACETKAIPDEMGQLLAKLH